MASNQTRELKKKFEGLQKKDFKIAWRHMNWEHKVIHIAGWIAFIYLGIKLGAYISNLIG